MNNREIETIKRQKNTESPETVNNNAADQIKEPHVNTYHDKLTFDSEVVYLRKRKVRRRKTGGIF